MLRCIFVFGKQGRYGLVKAFVNKPPRPESSIIDVMHLQLNRVSAGTPEDASWRNDERELSLRDRAHYTACQPMTPGFLAVLMLSAWALLNLSGRYSPFAPAPLLDKRERATRDHAHYVAYRIVLLTLTLGLAAILLTAGWTLRFVEQSAPMLLWGFCLYVMSLPQSVILWTEPEPLPDGTLTLVGARP